MKPRFRHVLPALATVVLGIALAAGCAGWPVQEMSNARQAIVAAQKAGADKYAPDTLAEAQKLLDSAKASASKGDYRAARDEADQAREKAIEARKVAEAAKAPKPAATESADPTPEAGAKPHP